MKMFLLRHLALILVGCGLLCSLNAVRGQGEGGMTQPVTFTSETLGDFTYTVYLPAGYATSEDRYPVIYLLHRRGDDMSGWAERASLFDRLIADGDIPPMIAVMPDAPWSDRASYYVDSAYTGAALPGSAVETAIIRDLIPHVDSEYRTVAEREGRALAGYSMGGYGAARYALAYPELFSGAIILSPAVYTPLPPEDSSTREFGAFGLGDALFDAAVYERLNYPALLESVAASELSLTLFMGVGDDEYKHPNPEDALHDIDLETHLLFNRVSRVPNIAAELRVYGGGHDWDVWERGFIEGARFLFSRMGI